MYIIEKGILKGKKENNKITKITMKYWQSPDGNIKRWYFKKGKKEVIGWTDAIFKYASDKIGEIEEIRQIMEKYYKELI